MPLFKTIHQLYCIWLIYKSLTIHFIHFTLNLWISWTKFILTFLAITKVTSNHSFCILNNVTTNWCWCSSNVAICCINLLSRSLLNRLRGWRCIRSWFFWLLIFRLGRYWSFIYSSRSLTIFCGTWCFRCVGTRISNFCSSIFRNIRLCWSFRLSRLSSLCNLLCWRSPTICNTLITTFNSKDINASEYCSSCCNTRWRLYLWN